jgi:benzoylformate decarboxylase
MTSARAAAYELLRTHEMTTMFGNPGSTELPMLHNFPGDFTYVLGLPCELAMERATGRPYVHVIQLLEEATRLT